ncbi:hypothetical protein GCM10027422_25440 [Hymenobacter arcticus]
MQKFNGQYNDLENSAIFRQINPVIYGQPLYTYNENGISWSVDDYGPDKFEQALQQSIKQREEVIKQNVTFSNFQGLGRILYFETQITTCDGAAEFQTNGFIDGSDALPIDTWFYLDHDIRRQDRRVPNLFCWIPKQFELIMEEAISVEIFGSYHWLDEAGTLTHRQIVAAMAE